MKDQTTFSIPSEVLKGLGLLQFFGLANLLLLVRRVDNLLSQAAVKVAMFGSNLIFKRSNASVLAAPTDVHLCVL